jgi:pyruvate dehydrogenase E2 component (dihydrolipoamide acetyltransferase)
VEPADQEGERLTVPIEILMPALSPTMEKGTLAKWHVKPGDKVSSGDVVAEIETDKATMEVEAVDEGTVGEILVSEGTLDVPVNQPIATLLAEGEKAGEKKAGAAGGGEKAAASAPAAPPSQPSPARGEGSSPAGVQQGTTSAGASKGATTQPSPLAGEVAARSAVGGGAAAGSAVKNGQVVETSGDRVFASPLARRLAREAGIALDAVAGSGPHGRVVKSDIEAAVASGGAKAAPAPKPAAALSAPAAPMALPAGPSDEAVMKLFRPGSFEVVPHDSMRKVIARRLTESKLTIPHFYLTVDVSLDALLALREQVNASAPEVDGKPAWKVSVNDFVIKALALALRRVPDANVSWTDGGMLKHKVADVGVAVSIPGGLITPVVRDADAKTLSVIANEMKDFAARARARKLKPEEYQGGSTAVSNLGMFGVKDFAAVINPPHATILAVGAGEKRPVVKGDQIVVGTVMSATLSTDHRAVDGALGAELIAAFKTLIEKPMAMLV